jgi:hypothetical protein
MTSKNVWTRAYLIPEQNRTGRRQEEGKNCLFICNLYIYYEYKPLDTIS